MSDIILKVITISIPCGLFGFIGYIFWIISKIIVAAMICKHPELSDEKVKSLTHMISKTKQHRFN